MFGVDRFGALGSYPVGVPPMSRDPIAEAKQQWVLRGWGEADVMATMTSIVRVQQLLSAGVDGALRSLDLTFARYEALVLLHWRGFLPLGKMSERLQVHPTSVTSIVDRLEKQGLVRRVRSETDRRTVLAEILPLGRDVVEKATEVVVKEVFCKVTWSEDDLRVLFNLLAQFRRDAGDFK